jgi:hypothetical protein
MLKVSDYKYLKKIYLNNKNKKSRDKDYKKSKIFLKDKINLKILKRNGFCILRGVFSKDYINNINLDFQNQIKILKNISIPRDLRNKKNNIEEIYLPKLPKKLFNLGENIFRNFTDSIKVKDPLINLPKILEIALNERIISICSNYFGIKPNLTFLKCVKTYSNNLDSHDTQHYHIDENAVKLLKVFVYLNDVESTKDGPFQYVKKSFLNIKKQWGLNARWDEKYLSLIYKKKDFVPILAKKGDVIIANTVAFHKGIKPTKKDRNIIILNYGLHMDYTFNNKQDLKAKILKKDYMKQNMVNRKILSLLDKIA